MKRTHVFEFEDAPWFPAALRNPMTNLIVVLSRLLGVPQVMSALVRDALAEAGTDQIVDLGSGGGGTMPDVLEALGRDDVSLVLTDLHPNAEASARLNALDRVTYHPTPVDATDLARAPAGLKTMTNCFHHMRPEQAKRILRSAQDSRQPLLVYEMGDNLLPLPVWVLLLPISLPLVFLTALALTPKAKPTLQTLVLTYLIPIIPACYAWDGQASMPRIYTPEDLDELLVGLDAPDYRWTKGVAHKEGGGKLGSYLLGMPV